MASSRALVGASKTASPTRPLPVNEWIELFGFGFGQIKICSAIGGIWLADGAELLLLSSLMRAVSLEWNLSAAERGTIVSVVFFGVMLGNLLSGLVGDGRGRRVVPLFGFAMVFLCSVLSVFAWSFASLAVIRLGVGVAVGLGQPSGVALANEVVPASYRILIPCTVTVFFALGELVSIVLIYLNDANMRNLDWRFLIVAGAVPSVLFGVYAYFTLPESPAFLHTVLGQEEQAVAVLEQIRSDNWKNRHGPLTTITNLRVGKNNEQDDEGSSSSASSLREAIARKAGLTLRLPRASSTLDELPPNSVWKTQIRLRKAGDRSTDGAALAAAEQEGHAGPDRNGTAGRLGAEDVEQDGYSFVPETTRASTASTTTAAPSSEGVDSTGGFDSGLAAATAGATATVPVATLRNTSREGASDHPLATATGTADLSEMSWVVRYLTVLCPPYATTTLFLCWSLFTCNVVYYGGMYVFPQVLADMGDVLEITPAMSLLLAASFEVLGAAVAVTIGGTVLRKPALLIWLVGGLVCVSCFIAGAPSAALDNGGQSTTLDPHGTAVGAVREQGGESAGVGFANLGMADEEGARWTQGKDQDAGELRKSWARIGEELLQKVSQTFDRKEHGQTLLVADQLVSEEGSERPAGDARELVLRSTPLGPALVWEHKTLLQVLEDPAGGTSEGATSGGYGTSGAGGRREVGKRRAVLVEHVDYLEPARWSFLEGSETRKPVSSGKLSHDGLIQRQEHANGEHANEDRKVTSSSSSGTKSSHSFAAETGAGTATSTSKAASASSSTSQAKHASAAKLYYMKSGNPRLLQSLMQLGLFGQKVAVILGFSFSTVYAMESFPTAVKATGTSVAIGVGRLGAITSPMIYEYLRVTTGGHEGFFLFILALLFGNLLMLLFLPLRETGQGGDSEPKRMFFDCLGAKKSRALHLEDTIAVVP